MDCNKCNQFEHCICVLCDEIDKCDNACHRGDHCIDFMEEYKLKELKKNEN